MNLHNFLTKFGIYYAKRRYMPRGIDWLWDLKRQYESDGTDLVIFDIGANVGQTTTQAIQYFPRAAFYAFEPICNTFELLTQRFQKTAKVKTIHVAVSDSCGSVSIVASSNSQLSHLVMDDTKSNLRDETLETVNTITIDVYCERHGINHIDILKTDTEGHDLQVLKGARLLFGGSKIDWVLVEVSFNPTDKTHSYFEDVCKYLTDNGMEAYCFYDHYFSHGGFRQLFCNVLFVRKGLSTERV